MKLRKTALKSEIQKIYDLISNKEKNNPSIRKQLILQKKSIEQVIKDQKQKRRELNIEWDDKWYNYEQYQELVLYIKDAQSKKEELIKSAEKRRQIEEKNAMKKNKMKENEGKSNQGEVIELVKLKPQVLTLKEKNAYEIGICNWLINFFKNIDGKVISQTQLNSFVLQEANKNSNIDSELKSGLLKEINSNDDVDIIGIGKDNKKKEYNKYKSNKTSKNTKETKSNILNLDISIIAQIKQLGLVVPALKTEVHAFLDTLSKKIGVLSGELPFSLKPIVENQKVGPNKETKEETVDVIMDKKEEKVTDSIDQTKEVKNDENVNIERLENEKVNVTQEKTGKKDKGNKGKNKKVDVIAEKSTIDEVKIIKEEATEPVLVNEKKEISEKPQEKNNKQDIGKKDNKTNDSTTVIPEHTPVEIANPQQTENLKVEKPEDKSPKTSKINIEPTKQPETINKVDTELMTTLQKRVNINYQHSRMIDYFISNKVYSYELVEADANYYDLTLEERQKFLRAENINCLCKTIILENTAFSKENESKFYSRYYLCVVQYTKKFI